MNGTSRFRTLNVTAVGYAFRICPLFRLVVYIRKGHGWGPEEEAENCRSSRTPSFHWSFSVFTIRVLILCQLVFLVTCAFCLCQAMNPEERAQFHAKEAERKEERLFQLFSESSIVAAPEASGPHLDLEGARAFFTRHSDRLYMEPFARGLLQLSKTQLRHGNVIYWRLGSETLTQSEDAWMEECVRLLRNSLAMQCKETARGDAYTLYFDPKTSNAEIKKLKKALDAVVRQFKHKTRPSGTLIVDNLDTLRPNFDPRIH